MHFFLRNFNPPALQLSCRMISNYVNRIRHLSELKDDDEACHKALSSGTFLLFHDLVPLVQKIENKYTAPFVTATELKKLDQAEKWMEESVLIGCTESLVPQFALDIGKSEKARAELLLKGKFISFWKAGAILDRNDIFVLSQARALLRWHSTHLYCSRTGKPTQKNVSGSKRVCGNDEAIYYPQMSPVVLMLVSDGAHCLLARQKQFPPGMYSALAGFCNIGESVEDSVRREVAEEVGLRVTSLVYSASQHWPFPISSLMIGYHAMVQPKHNKIQLNHSELQDARWFDATEVAEVLKRKMPRKEELVSFWIPPPWALAHHLIKEWTQKQ
ncbi:NAD(P)H pyrophosphatase NUDT13, mitochondrial [Rhinoraja longicauda]